ncbi:efflux RND transporter permease subunit [Acetobacteraceae bacterium H6797]|nr:efflux RND transporter permease subunit [Acetobacteraceae bacterium H6797]
MSRFFIVRPVFAWVVAIVIMLGGLIAVNSLPIAQYPTIAPPAIQITASYAGASAETLQNTVVQPIEQQMSGLDGLIYFSSTSNRDGTATMTLTFAQGVDPDVAQVQVQNKLSLATPRLPQTVQQAGIRVAKATNNFLLVMAFTSSDESLTSNDVADFIASNIQDAISRTPGVGDYQLFGAQYAMRIWLDPEKLVAYSLMPSDVTAAITSQNVQVASGELGARPSKPGYGISATIIGPSYLQTPEQFGNILIKVNADGSQLRLKDIAKVELDAQGFSISSKYNGRATAGLGVKLAPGGNAMDTADAVRATIERLKPSFPPGMEVAYPYDTTPFVRLSIHEVVKTLIEAMVLVFLVMLLFLQNIRATLIPTLAVPVVLLGTFGILALAGYSINTLTMFGMVLAIGLLVDDAIVVVENVERVMETSDMSPLEATRVSMDQISGALVGIGLVLSAVFLPMFFFGGSAGVIYRQFALTIVSAMSLSVMVALVFTPALCATILKRPKGHGTQKRGFFGWFNRGFDRMTKGYGAGVGGITKRPLRLMIVYLLLVGGMGFFYTKLPSSFLPEEDQGLMLMQVTTPVGSTAEATQRALDDVTTYLRHDEQRDVDAVFAINGFSFAGRGQNMGLIFVRLKDWSLRKEAGQAASAIAGRTMQRFGGYAGAQVFAFIPPSVPELGNASGFDMYLVDQAGRGQQALMGAMGQLLSAAQKSNLVVAVRPNTQLAEPQLNLDIDWEKARALGLDTSDVTGTLAAAFGGSYVNDFVDRGRVKRVYLQGNDESRLTPEDLGRWYVRNSAGNMVSLNTFISSHWTLGSAQLSRYNGTLAVEILGAAAPGRSTGEAMAEMEKLASQLPPGFSVQWTGLSYQERAAGSQAMALYAFSLIVVFLCLAALYESWAIPIAVMLVVPLGILGVVLATFGRGLGNDVYFQVGLLTTVGLTAKNAILIVEFAKEHFEQGENLFESALHAAKERLRPILMTSMAFVLGVVPLAISTGAGAGGRVAIGTGIVGGVAAGTLLAIFFVPLFFVLVLRLFRTKRLSERHAEPTNSAAPAQAGAEH